MNQIRVLENAINKPLLINYYALFPDDPESEEIYIKSLCAKKYQSKMEKTECINTMLKALDKPNRTESLFLKSMQEYVGGGKGIKLSIFISPYFEYIHDGGKSIYGYVKITGIIYNGKNYKKLTIYFNATKSSICYMGKIRGSIRIGDRDF